MILASFLAGVALAIIQVVGLAIMAIARKSIELADVSLSKSRGGPQRPVMPGGRYAVACTLGAIGVADEVIAIVALLSWDRFYGALGWWGVFVMAALLLMPFLVASVLARYCTAWNDTVEGRCARIRPGLLRRCGEETHSHRHQLVTLPELTCVTCALLGVAVVWLMFSR